MNRFKSNLGPNVGDIICWVTRPSWAGSPKLATHPKWFRPWPSEAGSRMTVQDLREKSIVGKISKSWKDGDLEIGRITIYVKERTLVNPKGSTCI